MRSIAFWCASHLGPWQLPRVRPPTAAGLNHLVAAGWTDEAVTDAASSGRRDAFLLSVQLQPEQTLHAA